MDIRSHKCCVLPKVALNKEKRRKTVNRAIFKQDDYFGFHDQIESYLQSVHDDALQEKPKKKGPAIMKPFQRPQMKLFALKVS